MVEEDLADHIDLNFGCPVPKVTRKGGGSALPYKRRLFESIVRDRGPQPRPTAGIPVTVKMRIGIDPEHITYPDAGRIAEDCGVAAVALHGRTAIQHYSGHRRLGRDRPLEADWSPAIPVLGNGDIFAASDALDMMAADRLRRRRRRARLPGPAVAVRRTGRRLRRAGPAPTPPDLRAVTGGPAPARRTALRRDGSRPRHPRPAQTHRLVPQGVRRRVGARRTLGMVSSLAELDPLIAGLDLDQPFPAGGDGPRGRQGSPQRRVRAARRLAGRPGSEVVPDGAELDTAAADVPSARRRRIAVVALAVVLAGIGARRLHRRRRLAAAPPVPPARRRLFPPPPSRPCRRRSTRSTPRTARPAAQRAVLDQLVAADHAAEQRRCPPATTTVRLEPVWGDATANFRGSPSVYAVPAVVRIVRRGVGSPGPT